VSWLRTETRLSVAIGFAVIQPGFLVHMNICWRNGLARQWLEEWPANGRTDHSHEDSRAHRVRSTDPYAGMTRMEAGHRALPDEQCAVRREMRMPQMTGEVLYRHIEHGWPRLAPRFVFNDGGATE